MSLVLKNASATYMRAMTTIFRDILHKEIKVYVDDIIIKSRKSLDNFTHLKKIIWLSASLQLEVESLQMRF